MEQSELLLRHRRREEPPDSILFNQKTLLDVVRLMIACSGYKEDQVGCALGYSKSHWSEILGGSKNLPWSTTESGKGGLEEAMDFCESDMPLVWICNKRGYQKPVLKQTELEKKYEALERRYEAITEFAKGLVSKGTK